MPEFSFDFIKPLSIVINVEAEDQDEALEKAWEILGENDPGLCVQCSNVGFGHEDDELSIDEGEWDLSEEDKGNLN